MLTGVTPFAPARHSRRGFLAVLSILSLCAGAAVTSQAPAAVTLDQLRQGFVEPPPDSRIMMRWWWFGPSVEKPELERELRAMKDGGIGGVEIQPVYPVTLDDPARGLRNFNYLSPEFLEDLLGQVVLQGFQHLGIFGIRYLVPVAAEFQVEAVFGGIDQQDSRVFDRFPRQSDLQEQTFPAAWRSNHRRFGGRHDDCLFGEEVLSLMD